MTDKDKKTANNIGDNFNMESGNMEIFNDSIKEIFTDAHNDSAQVDFDYARANQYKLIESAQLALEELMTVAISSQNPKSFEVLHGMLKTMADLNKDLLTMQKDIKSISNKDVPNSRDAKTINNTLYVGTTAEMSKMLREIKDYDENK